MIVSLLAMMLARTLTNRISRGKLKLAIPPLPHYHILMKGMEKTRERRIASHQGLPRD